MSDAASLNSVTEANQQKPLLGLFAAVSYTHLWALIAVIFWQAGGGDWVARITGASGQIPISAARFWSLDFLIFYAYYIVCVGLFALFWFIYSPHRWQYWSILGTALIIFVTWFLVEVGVAVNAWYAPFYDLIQTALSSPHKVTIEQFYREVGVFLGIALIAVVISVLNNFFVSHYVFRWRTAMNEYYMANWQQPVSYTHLNYVAEFDCWFCALSAWQHSTGG